MVSDSAPQRLTTVLAGVGDQIHLAVVAAAGPDEQRVTLCRRQVTGRVPAQRFHRLGCRDCAAEAIEHGVTSIEDREHATVNLPRFLAAATMGT